ncbi:MAG TPA: c-type cytochrome [Verrucomicrobiae bacterium]|jgi:thiosulfate dehydrogenase|nr:c-type cytochrome [Verrucomicrobiae bacterium]
MMREIVVRSALALTACITAFFLFSSASVSFSAPQSADSAKAWVAPDATTIPAGALGDSIRLGMQVFNNTPKYAEKYVGNKLSCTHCHVDGGTVSKGMPMVGLIGMFPMYRDREKTVITFEERIQQCFQRSEFGHRLPNDGPEMTGLVAYVQWLSKDQVTGRPFPGRGLVELPELNGDAAKGSKIYADQCAVCHGNDGEGKLPLIPAVWGPDSYSDGAGMHQIPKMAAFVQHNMPQNDPGTLTPQDAYDVSAYVHSMPHTQFVMKDHMQLGQ